MNVKLIDNWAQVWKMYSVWAMVILGMLPEIVDVFVQYGLISQGNSTDSLNKLMKLVMVAGIVLRMVSQKKAEVDAAEAAKTKTE